MGASDKPEILREAEDLERDIDKRRREVRDLECERRSTLKRRRSWLVLLGVVMVTLFLTSSCSLHAGELLGRWDVEQIFTAMTDPLQGIIDKAEEANTALYVVTSVLGAVLMLPFNLLIAVPYGFLKLGAEMLEAAVPSAIPFVPYVEVGLVLLMLVGISFLQVSDILSNNRSVRADVRSIDARIRGVRDRSECPAGGPQGVGGVPGGTTPVAAPGWQGQAVAVAACSHGRVRELLGQVCAGGSRKGYGGRTNAQHSDEESCE